MSTCTWEGCAANPTRRMFDKQNVQWADLCEDHHTEFERAVTGLSGVPALLSCWVKAQGGAKKAAARM